MKKVFQIIPHKGFTKQLKKQSPKIRDKVKARLLVFIHNPSNQLLNNHALTGKWKGYRSINITGDTRAIYQRIGDDTAIFVAIGTYSQLYS